ncbi:HAD-IIA family hydrolase [Arthrobacter castelli]|uniref:HAD-IIA family hydrolase n=1 Tax=Arthrobacter castelli TaxID=271431 RepID=UPI000409AF57|nr:HAD-IIA family hydrolase [Arthrobacter castelli]
MSPEALINGYDAVLADLDGVVYTGPEPIDGAIESLLKLSEYNVSLGYVTNNASRTPQAVAEQLSSLGAPATPDQVVTSAQAGARLLAGRLEPGSRVLVAGSAALVAEVEQAGLSVVRSADDSPAAVVQGFDPGLGWQILAEASYAVAAGAWWVATNTDMTLPRDRGIAPGNGAMVAAVQVAVGGAPVVAGKPEAPLFHAAAERLGAERPLIVGDRLNTDILGGTNAGMDTAAVLTGIDTLETILAARSAERPHYLLADLRGLYEPYPETVREGALYRCRQSSAKVSGGEVRISGARDDLDTWRAACAAWWAATPDADEATVPVLVE